MPRPSDLVVWLALCAVTAGADAGARTDYMLHCMGCHLADGSGMPPAVPALKDRIGYYLRVPGGREYLVQVPGAANAPLSDAALAAVINWIVQDFAGASAPDDSRAFTADEVAEARGQRPVDISSSQRALAESIRKRFPSAAF